MATFVETINPTPFGFYDSDLQFQQEADAMVIYVKRSLGDDILSCELTKKQIWSCFEQACCEYSRLVSEMKIQSELVNVLGLPTGSTDLTNVYPRQTLEYFIRQAEPYATEAHVGGSYDPKFGYITMKPGVQDYDIYNDIMDATTNQNMWLSIPDSQKTKMRIFDIFHFEPTAAQHFLLNASNVTNFMAQNFNYESYVNSSIFYVLPVFEDVLRRSMLETSFRVRRSQYSYDLMGSKLRIYPIPSMDSQLGKLFVKVLPKQQNPLSTDIGGSLSGSYTDSTMHGISGPNNFPINNIPFSTITAPGRQWIRQYTLATSKELLGLIRSKFNSIPIPGADLTLNGETLRGDGREDQTRLRDQLKEWLLKLTNQSLIEQQASLAEQLNKQLRYIPMPTSIYIM